MITVLITGCGGAIGTGIIEALRMGTDDLRLIGVDSDPFAAYFYLKSKGCLLDKKYIIPRADHPKYVSKIIDICFREKVDVIFPCTDAELEILAISETKIAKVGTKIVISPLKTIRMCRDKWLTYCHLNKYLPMAKSAVPDNGIEKALQFTGLPIVVKPRLGWGSRQAQKVNTIEEAHIIVNNIEKPIIQEWLEGEEYTVDGMVDRRGKTICIIPRRRIRVLSGISFQGITVREEKLIEIGKKITEHLKFIGPFNFQVKKSKEEIKIIEINPRFAGTGILSAKAGVNLPLLAVKDMCNVKLPTNIDFVEGLVISRYFKGVFFKGDEVNTHAN